MEKKEGRAAKQGTERLLLRLKELDGTERFAVLATECDGKPYASLVAYACTPDMKGVLFATDRRTRKYRNILRGDSVALLIDTRSSVGRVLEEGEALTITGRASVVRRGRMRDSLAGHYAVKHPSLEGFVNAPDTALVTVSIEEMVHVTRFQKVSVWKREP